MTYTEGFNDGVIAGKYGAFSDPDKALILEALRMACADAFADGEGAMRMYLERASEAVDRG